MALLSERDAKCVYASLSRLRSTEMIPIASLLAELPADDARLRFNQLLLLSHFEYVECLVDDVTWVRGGDVAFSFSDVIMKSEHRLRVYLMSFCRVMAPVSMLSRLHGLELTLDQTLSYLADRNPENASDVPSLYVKHTETCDTGHVVVEALSDVLPR